MKDTKPSIIVTLFFCMGQGNSHYSVAAVNTILELLSKFHKIKIKRRWLFQCMKDLIDAGFIKRDPRHRNDDNGLITQIPSMIFFKLRGIVWLVNMGVKGAREIYKRMVAHINGPDKRAPKQKDLDDGSYKPADPNEAKRLKDLLESVTKPIS